MSKLTYTRCGDYYIPDLKLAEQPEAPIGKYGRMRQRYLKEHRPSLYSSLILSEKLYPHLLEIDRTARERMDAMLPRMMEAACWGFWQVWCYPRWCPKCPVHPPPSVCHPFWWQYCFPW